MGLPNSNRSGGMRLRRPAAEKGAFGATSTGGFCVEDAMLAWRRSVPQTAVRVIAVAAVSASLAACTTTSGGPGEEKAATSEASGAETVSAEDKDIIAGGGVHKVGKPYQIGGEWYTPELDPEYDHDGRASWYGPKFHGRTTANGEIFDQFALTAAHPTMPLPSYARVTNRDNGRSIIVRVNDRGPFADDRIIDVSRKTAELLGFKGKGTADVNVQYAGPADVDGSDMNFLMASYTAPGATTPAENGEMPATMLAMNAPAEDRQLPGVAADEAIAAATEQAAPQQQQAAATALQARMSDGEDANVPQRMEPSSLPNVGPVVTQRPASARAYVGTEVASAADPFAHLMAEDESLSASAIVESFNRRTR